MSFLTLEGIRKSYDGQRQVLDGISIHLNKGDLLGLIGASGSGKSTLLRIAAGLEFADEGEVFLAGNRILNPTQKLVAGYDEIQLVHQHFNLFPLSTVEENIRRALLLYDKDYAKERTENLLEIFQLTQMRDRLPRELSGGQQQKVAIARALSVEPEVLLFDEPFCHLDPVQKRSLLEEIREVFQKLHVTGIWVTHDVEDALMLTHKLLVIDEGVILQQGDVGELYYSPNSRTVAELFSPLNALPGSNESFLRPEAVSIVSEGNVSGKIVESRFLPAQNQLTVALDEGTYWKVGDPARIHAVNDTVYLTWSEKDVLRF